MKFTDTNLPGVIIIEPKVFGDERGFFLETFRTEAFSRVGITEQLVQANHSRSTSGVLRGLHYQLVQPQGKLVRVARGSVYDVAVDVRRGSPHFGDWYGATLDDTDMRMMYIPPGFAHGFVVLSEVADFIYQCTDYYHPESEQGIAWNDPDIGIEWPIQNVSLSEKDRRYPTLSEQSEANLPLYYGV